MQPDPQYSIPDVIMRNRTSSGRPMYSSPFSRVAPSLRMTIICVFAWIALRVSSIYATYGSFSQFQIYAAEGAVLGRRNAVWLDRDDASGRELGIPTTTSTGGYSGVCFASSVGGDTCGGGSGGGTLTASGAPLRHQAQHWHFSE